MRCVPLSHGGSDATKHRPCGLIGHTDLVGQLNSGQPSFVLGDEIEGQKPLAQADMAVVQNRPSRDGSLTVAVGTLVQAVGQAATMFVSAFRANKAVWPALCGQIVPAVLLRSKLVQNSLSGIFCFLGMTHFLPFRLFCAMCCPVFRTLAWLSKRDNQIIRYRIGYPMTNMCWKI